MRGKTRKASPEALRAVLELFGVSAATPEAVRDAIRLHDQTFWREPLSRVIVLWDGKPQNVEVRLPAASDPREIRCLMHLEDGGARSIDLEPGVCMPATYWEGTEYCRRTLRLPALPFGYHHLEIEVRGRVHRSLIISAPSETYSPSNADKRWGTFLPLYAAHSARSWGGGDLSDFRKLTAFTSRLGGSFTGTLPLLSTFLEGPDLSPSPYAPVSRLFWNEYYVAVDQCPAFRQNTAARRLVESKNFQTKLQEFRNDRFINYPGEMAARREVLQILAQDFFADRAPNSKSWQRFLKERPRAPQYAAFRAARENTGICWQQWEPRMRCGKLQEGDFDPKTRDYYLFAQWQADEQVQLLLDQSRSRKVELYLDLPLGVHPDGYDAWRFGEAFASPARVGAPPDLFFPLGQDWGFAPPHPQKMRDTGYDYLLEYLRFQMRHTDLLRIDHVMGLHRLFWIPPGFGAEDGVYVGYPGEELHAILSIESHRNKTVLVGENLGTVPPEVNQAMERHGLRQMYVVQYEQKPDAARALRTPPQRCIASLNTHDMPTFRAHWEGADIDDRVRLKLIPGGSVKPEHRKRSRLGERLIRYLRKSGIQGAESSPPDSAEGDESATRAMHACLRWLALSPAEMVMVNLEDLWGERDPQNVPGTSTQCPNWCRKAALTIEQIQQSSEIKRALQDVQELRGVKANRGRKRKLRR